MHLNQNQHLIGRIGKKEKKTNSILSSDTMIVTRSHRLESASQPILNHMEKLVFNLQMATLKLEMLDSSAFDFLSLCRCRRHPHYG